MAVRLIVEVLAEAPTTLTHREKLLLVALAEDANDDTRVTWNSIEHPKILRGAKLSRSQLYAVIKSLIAKGALTKVTAGQKNGAAKYKIAYFAESQRPGIPDTDSSSQRPDSRDAEGPQRPGTSDTEPLSQCPENPDTDPSQCQEIRDVSVPESGTPTPLYPSSTTPSSKQEELQSQPADVTFGIPPDARPLTDAIRAAGLNVRWPFKGNGWFPVLALINKVGVHAMTDYAVTVAQRTRVESAKYFLKGWAELAPLPTADSPRPALRAIPGGGWQPYRNPADPSVYENGF
ncbi:hypothetical protein AB0B79_30460 [Streptomyces sp. NPDC039022]|uniref:hypothetical protein n=1 Tax=Streptomyces sp. NPDC039022 TaxID=3157091 RepID=UPI0033C9854A